MEIKEVVVTGNIKNSDSMDILNQIRIPLSDITGISRLLKYNLATWKHALNHKSTH